LVRDGKPDKPEMFAQSAKRKFIKGKSPTGRKRHGKRKPKGKEGK